MSNPISAPNLPNFLVIGAHKCGTTALYHALQQHPQVFMSSVKEPSFFTFERTPPRFNSPDGEFEVPYVVCDLPAYQALFEGTTSETARGEASPIYLSWYRPEQTARNIRRHVPDMKLIAILRQPAVRAYSEYYYQRQLKAEPCRTFREALAVEDRPERADWYPDLFYFRTGLYSEALKPYCTHFHRRQLRVYLYEEWNAHPEAVMRDMFRFLEVDDGFAPDLTRRHNVTYRRRSRALDTIVQTANPLRTAAHWITPRSLRHGIAERLYYLNRARPPRLRAALCRQLTERYRDDIMQLQGMIDRDLSRWLQNPRRG
jgi:hypothetical protein